MVGSIGARSAARRLSNRRNPARLAIRRVGKPAWSSHRWSESAPRCFCTTRTAVPSLVNRSSQPARRSWSAALPIRIGGFDQIVAKRTSGGTSLGAAVRMFLSPLRSALCVGQLARPFVRVDGPDRRCRAAEGERHGDRARTTAQVEQVARRRWYRRLAEQQRRPGVHVAVGEHAAVGHHRECDVGQGDVHRASVGGDPGLLVEVVRHAR